MLKFSLFSFIINESYNSNNNIENSIKKRSTKMITKSISSPINKIVKNLFSINANQQKYFSHFDCKSCSKKTVHPECTAC